MKKNNLGYLFASLAILSSIFCWLSVQRAVEVAGASTWGVPILSFSFLLIFLFGAIIFLEKKAWVVFLSMLISLISIFFGRGFWQIPGIFLAVSLIITGAVNIRNDFNLNIKIDFINSLNTGKMQVIGGLIILIVAQYFVMIGRIDGEKILPKFEIGKTAGQFAMRFMSGINPAFEGVKNDEMTADEFILQTQLGQMQSIDEKTLNEQTDIIIKSQYGSKAISEEQRLLIKNQIKEKMIQMQSDLSQSNKNLILKEGRRQLSQMTGQEILGNEKMYDIFSGLINKKINDYVVPSVDSPDKTKILPTILAIFLFFTLWPIGSLLGFISIRFIALVMYILKKTSSLKIKKVMVEMEVIE